MINGVALPERANSFERQLATNGRSCSRAIPHRVRGLREPSFRRPLERIGYPQISPTRQKGRGLLRRSGEWIAAGSGQDGRADAGKTDSRQAVSLVSRWPFAARTLCRLTLLPSSRLSSANTAVERIVRTPTAGNP